MTTINTDNYTLDLLPAESLVEAFSYVEPSDLSNFSKVNRNFRCISMENSIWKVVANKIGLPLAEITEENSARNQVRTHILSLKKEIKELEEPLPEDIAGIIVSKSIPSFEEIQLLKDYRKARDIIVVWTKLDLNSVPVIAIEQPAKVMIAQANQFTNWFAQNRQKFANLQSLNLRDKKLSFLPSEICQLTQLTRLNLSFNSLIALPSGIGQLTRLTRLNLSFNNLSVLPIEIGLLTRLTQLNLSFNKLTVLPPEIGHLTQLVELSLSNNNLSNLPSQLGQLIKLFELNLRNNQLFILPGEYEIGHRTNLQWLNLGRNNFSIVPSEISQLNIPYLYLEGNLISKKK